MKSYYLFKDKRQLAYSISKLLTFSLRLDFTEYCRKEADNKKYYLN